MKEENSLKQVNSKNFLNLSAVDHENQFRALNGCLVKFCSGLTTVIGYEPWAERAIDSARQSLADGVPILIRLHPGADYPCSELSTYYKQDMEGHVVLLIGYDDYTRMFDAVDPWSGKGEYGGIIKLPYEIMPLRCMNATADKASRPTPPEINIDVICGNSEPNKALKISAGYYLPLGYIIDRKDNYLSHMIFDISFKSSGKMHHINHIMNGSFPVDKKAEALLPLPDSIDGVVEFEINFECIVGGTRPYPYEDHLCMKFNKQVIVNHSSESVVKVIKFRIAA